jgi:hypothetical protein
MLYVSAIRSLSDISSQKYTLLDVALLFFVYFCEDMTDDSCAAETCSIIMRRQGFTINIHLCLFLSVDYLIPWRLFNDDVIS